MKKRGDSRFTLAINSNLSRSKRSQVTILIILAIVVIVGVAVYLSLSNQSSTINLQSAFSKLNIDSQVGVVESSIINCLELTAKDADDLIGIQGGYYKDPGRSVDLGFSFIPYYYDQGTILQPTTDTIQNQLNLYIEENLGECIDSLNFEGFSIKHDSTESDSIIKNKEINFKIGLSMNIQKDDSTTDFSIKNHPLTIKSPLGDVIEIATYITESHKEDSELICISCVSDLAEEKNLFVDLTDFDQEIPTTLVVITEVREGSTPYIFEFLNRYS
jgi:hypothetical protein